MGMMPSYSRELLSPATAHAVRRGGRASRWWPVVVVGSLAAYLPLLARSTTPALAVLPWLLAPFLAAVGWSHAAGRAESRARAAFRLFHWAAVAGLLAQLLWAYRPDPEGAVAVVASYLLLLPPVLLVPASALVLGARRGRLWSPGHVVDALLLLLVAVAASLRLVVEPAVAAGSPPRTSLLLVVFQGVSVLPVFLAALVVLRRGTALSPRAGALLLAATLGFALGGVLSLTGLDARPFGPGDSTDFVELAGWMAFAAAGFSARRVPATATAMLARRRVPDAVRKLVVPGAALFLSIAVVDMGLGPAARPETVAVVALLALALAVRTARAFSLVDREADQRRRLAHTRALVDVTHALAGTTELDEALRVISESARAVFGTRAAGIELLTDDGRSLETRSALGLPGDVVGLRFPLEGSFTGWVVRHEEPRATVDPTRDPYIQPESLAFLGRWPVAAAPIQFRGETLGALFACIRSEPFDAEELELLGALAEQAAIAIQNARLFEQVTTLSVTDPLTGLANRRQLERELAREFAAAHRGRPLTVAIFDLDRFKDYNDSFGHLAGDEALQTFARCLRQETRAMNFAARYGGDEFVAVLAGTGSEGARTFVERVRIRFGLAVAGLGHGPLTVSAGVAEFAPEMRGPEALLRKADDRLYQAKPARV